MNELKAKYYIRYVDDFVILNNNKNVLENYKKKIDIFLKERLKIELHPTKSNILLLKREISFLGFRNYPHHRLLRKTNVRTMRKRITQGDYDSICEFLEGWMSYAKQANTYNLRHKVADSIESNFIGNIHSLQIDRLIKQKNKGLTKGVA